MYRALTWWMIRQEVDVASPVAVAAYARRPAIEVGTDPQAPVIMVDGTDVTAVIRTREVSNAVSAVARVPEVRVHDDTNGCGGISFSIGRTTLAPLTDTGLLRRVEQLMGLDLSRVDGG